MKTFYQSLLLLLFINVTAQNPLENYEIGWYLDSDGNLIDGYMGIDYMPRGF